MDREGALDSKGMVSAKSFSVRKTGDKRRDRENRQPSPVW